MHGRGRKARTDGEIAQAIAFVVFSERFDDRERAVDGLDTTVARVGFTVRAGLWLDGLAPDHVSLHRDLHPSVGQTASEIGNSSDKNAASDVRSGICC